MLSSVDADDDDAAAIKRMQEVRDLHEARDRFAQGATTRGARIQPAPSAVDTREMQRVARLQFSASTCSRLMNVRIKKRSCFRAAARERRHSIAAAREREYASKSLVKFAHNFRLQTHSSRCSLQDDSRL